MAVFRGVSGDSGGISSWWIGDCGRRGRGGWCGERGFVGSAWLLAGDALFTLRARNPQGFWRVLWEAWERMGGCAALRENFPIVLNYTAGF